MNFSRVLKQLFLVAFLANYQFAYAVFSTPGTFNVSPDGSANYDIPIQVPPGTAGMTPKLSLHYSSSAGAGLLGKGFNISGLSQITRCPTTRAQDGVLNGIDYAATDRFCLDGQRLIALTDGYDSAKKVYTTTSSYGGNGVEYRTEQANFAKVISYGTAGTGPSWFKVWTKGGQIIEYGNTADSNVLAVGSPTVRTWGVNKISDTKGNYINVSYIEDNTTGEAYVSRIDYTGNANKSQLPYASVQFIYEARPDVVLGYQAGSVINAKQRIKNIKTYNGTTLVKDYRLVYEQSVSNSESRLISLTECDGSATAICLQPVVFNWQDGLLTLTKNTAFSNGLPTAYSSINGSYGGSAIIDINGDGLPDVIELLSASTTVGWFGGVDQKYVYLNTGSGYVKSTSYTNSLPDTWLSIDGSGAGTKIIDINGDGLPDIVQSLFANNGWYGTGTQTRNRVYLNTGTSFVSSTSYSSSLPDTWLSINGQNAGTKLVDIDGDGLPDIVQLLSANNGWYGSGTQTRRLVYLNTGSGFVKSTSYSSSLPDTWLSINGSNAGTRLIDIDGDGKIDIIQQLFANNGWYGAGTQTKSRVYLNTGTSFVLSTTYAGSKLPDTAFSINGSDPGADIMDVNGDGLPDIIQLLFATANTGWYGANDTTPATRKLIYLNTGAGFVKSTTYSNSLPDTWFTLDGADTGTNMADINGDGLPDIIQMLYANNGWYGNGAQDRRLVYLNTGTKFTKSTSYSNSLPDTYFSINGSYTGTQLNDINGDGLVDIVQLLSVNNGWYGSTATSSIARKLVYINNTEKDMVISITPGLLPVTNISYKPLTDKTIYVKDSGANQAVYPIQDIQSPQYVVSSYTQSDGIGGVVTTNYSYGGLKTDLSGRGPLGFRYVVESSPDSGIGITSFYRQDYPFIGLPSQNEKRVLSTNTLIGGSQYTYTNTQLPIGSSTAYVNFPWVNQSVESSFELDSTLINTTTTKNQYDAYGNLTQVNVQTSDGYSKNTVNQYINDTANWFLGRLIRSTVTSTAPDN